VQQPELLFSGLGPTPEERREQRKRYVDEVLETFWISTSSRRAKARTTSVGAESSATRARGTVPGDGE
jgi:hypothetical protein